MSRALLVATLALSSLACEQVDYIELSPSEMVFKQANNEKAIEARCMARTGVRAVKAQVGWSSADPSIATVSAKGVVKPVKSGKTEIIAKYKDIEARASVTVIFVERIEVEPKSLTLTEGAEAATLTVKAYGADGQLITDRTPTFTSKNKQVIQAGGGGLLPLDPGTATVEVQVDAVKTSVQVTVEADKKKR